MEVKFQQSSLSVCLLEVINFYLAQLYNNSIAILNNVRSSERKLVIIKRAVGNAAQSKMNNLENWMHEPPSLISVGGQVKRQLRLNF